MFKLATRSRLPAIPRAFVARPLAQSFYSTKKKVRPENAPRIRYLIMMVAVSFGCLHFVSTKVQKAPPKTSFSEREFKQYEQETGLKRRHKLVSFEKNEQYTFYALPYTHSVDGAVAKLTAKLPEHKQVKVIDPKELIEKEIEEDKRYSYLLQELKAQGREMPKGLITALVKEEVQLFMNTTRGQHDTNVILVNYPQTTEEAIKFENDVSDVHSCIVFDDEFANNIQQDLSEERIRKINNVVGYFDTVNKVKKGAESWE